MKKALCVLAAALLIILSGTAGICAKADANLPEEVINNPWYQDMNARLKVGNPTPMRGRFFTTLWGGSTSDLDVQDLLHAYSPILWDGTLGRFRFDRSVVDEAVIMNDEDGNRVYNLILFDDPSQDLPLPEQMLLTDDLIDGLRPQSCRQRLRYILFKNSHLFVQNGPLPRICSRLSESHLIIS